MHPRAHTEQIRGCETLSVSVLVRTTKLVEVTVLPSMELAGGAYFPICTLTIILIHICLRTAIP